MSVMSDKEYRCEVCDKTLTSRNYLMSHKDSDIHIRNAYNKMLQDEANRQYKQAIKTAKEETVKANEETVKAKEETAKLKKEKKEMSVELIASKKRFDDSITEINSIKMERDILKEQLNKMTIAFSALDSENQSLKAEMIKMETSSATEESVTSEGEAITFNNHSPLHEKYRNLMELLFGVKPIQYIKKGESGYAEFNTLRSFFCVAYNSIKIYNNHITTSNLSQHITLGLPTITTKWDGDNVKPFIYYIKYHIYLNEFGKATSLCAWDGVKEYCVIKYRLM